MPGDQLTEQPEPEVRVVETPGAAQDDVVVGQPQLGQRPAGDALPPTARALRAGTGQMGEQLAHRALAERGPGDVLLEQVRIDLIGLDGLALPTTHLLHLQNPRQTAEALASYARHPITASTA